MIVDGIKQIWLGLLLALAALLTLLAGGPAVSGDRVAAQMDNPFLDAPYPLNIAHRGASSLAPENTLAAARKAWELGANAWELDTQLTKDGVLIVMHDDTLERTTNAEEIFPKRYPWRVRDFTLEEIKQLDAGSWFIEADPFGEIAAGNVLPEELENYRGEPVPTLREALEFTKEHKWWVNVELKAIKGVSALLARRLSDELVEKTITLIRELGIEDRVIVSSFDHTMVYQLKHRAPEIAGAILVGTTPKDPLRYLRQVGAEAYNTSLEAFRPDIMWTLQEAGYRVNVWTVDDPDMMEELIELGVNGIFTNYPQRLRPLVGSTREVMWVEQLCLCP